jgi:UDP-N-acetylmuramyl pentapeptide phosphotransferase/UDP-N-acetylglucosamine-1-phosphate transferase
VWAICALAPALGRGAGRPRGSLLTVTASDVIAICALAFTVAAFWWLNARPGKLRIVGARSSYASKP